MGITFELYLPRKLEKGARSLGPDGPLLCNYRATLFKLNLQYVPRSIKLFNTAFHIRRSRSRSLFMRAIDDCDSICR
jgi:hypothetical protein